MSIYYWIVLNEPYEFNPYNEYNDNAYTLGTTIEEPNVYDPYISISSALAI